MRTTADARIEEARDATREAILSLSDVLIHECDGHDDYREDFVTRMEQAFACLQEARKHLKST